MATAHLKVKPELDLESVCRGMLTVSRVMAETYEEMAKTARQAQQVWENKLAETLASKSPSGEDEEPPVTGSGEFENDIDKGDR